MRWRKRSIVCIALGAILLLSAVALAAFNRMEDDAAGFEAKRVKEIISTTEPEYDAAGMEGEVEAIPDYVLNPEMEMPIVGVDGRYYIGVISIPQLDIELPVRSTWNYTKLKSSPCLYTGSIYSGDAIIMAHNFVSHFKPLWNAERGMEVYFTDADNNLFSYEVSQVEQLVTADLDGLLDDSTDWDLTLFTCTYNGKSRVVVRCTRN